MNPKTTWQALDLAITLLEQFESQLSASDKDMLNHLQEYRDFDRPMLEPSQAILDFVANEATPRLKALFGENVELSQKWDSNERCLIVSIWNENHVDVDKARALLNKFDEWYFDIEDDVFRKTLFMLRWKAPKTHA